MRLSAVGSPVAGRRRPVATLAMAWVVVVATMAAVRWRVEWNAYVDVHRWLQSFGVPPPVRHLDSMLICAVGALFGAYLATRLIGGTVIGLLRLGRAPRATLIGAGGLDGAIAGPAPSADEVDTGLHSAIDVRPDAHIHARADAPTVEHAGDSPADAYRFRPALACLMAVCACLPMVLGGLWIGLASGGSLTLAPLVSGTIRAPLAEELLYRGLLVAVPAAALGWRGRAYVLNLLLASLLFGMTHITWSWDGLVSGWPALLVTFVGGVWYAWLLSRWQLLWVTVILHAGMNLGWSLCQAEGGAGGGGWMENILRVATITIATVWTIRATRWRKLAPNRAA